MEDDNQENNTSSKQKNNPLSLLAVVGALVVLAVFVMPKLLGNKTSTETEVQPQDNVQIQGNQNATSSGDAAETTGDIKVFNVDGANYKFDTTEITVNKGDVVKIIFNNVEGRHDLIIDEFNVSTQVLNAGQKDEVQFIADKAGTFEYYCSVGEHRAMGMVGKLIVK